MNLKIIHSNFQLNLVDTSFTMIEENNWFSDRMFSKYTFPISRKLSDEEDAAFNFICDLFASGVQTVYDVIFIALDREHEAVMEIEKIQGRKIDFQIRYGFEDFPNFEKKLAQIPLHKFELAGETIFQHALSKIPLGYPATDYNFPRIFTDKFDTESAQWIAFEGSVNNYNGTVFLVNEYDAVEDVQLNRNVMQPLPSLLYVLKQGFADKGYALAGDILDDPEFKDAWLYSLSEYYSSIQEGEKQEMLINCDEFTGISANGNGYLFSKEIILAEAGRYKVAGNLFLQCLLEVQPFLRNSIGILLLDGHPLGMWSNINPREIYKLIDRNIDVPLGSENAVLKFTVRAANYRIIGDTRVYDAPILDVTVSQLTKYNPDGSAQPTLVLPTDIDLARCVPDVTFGDLYKAIKQWKNYGADIVGKTVYINRVKNQLGRGTVKDLTHTEVMEPERTPNQGKTFELKFADVSSEEYEFVSMFVDRNGSSLSPYVTKDDTEEIAIDAIPLPLTTRSGILTAHGFLDDDQKIQLVLYNGTTAGMNVCKDASELLIPAIYEDEYKEWIDFLLKTIGYLWTFNAFDINVADLHDKTTVFAYGKYHTVLKLSKKNLGTDDIIQTEIETYSIE